MTVAIHDETDIQTLLAPSAPFDDYTFDQLRDQYNYQQTSDWVKLFVRVLIKECAALPAPKRVLDIGCGVGIGRSPRLLEAVRREVDELWGLEPDPTVRNDAGLLTHFQNATMETAQLPENYFDLSFSFMVMEHVADPDSFMRAVHRSLRPGGVHIFITVNGHHYFTRVAKLMKSIRFDESLLRILRGRQEVDEYHYPVQYRFNKPAVIEEGAARLGFEKPEFVFVEELGPKPYFPLPIRPIWWLLAQKRHMIRDPKALLTLICRMRKRS